MADWINADQHNFLSFKRTLSRVLHPINVLCKSESISLPQKRSVGKEDVDLVG